MNYNIKHQTITIDLLSSFKDGDLGSFEIIYDTYFNKVFHFTCRFSLAKEDTEEIVQDVFLKLWQKRATIDADKNICNYLFAIAQNLVIDKARQNIVAEKHKQNVSNNQGRDLTSNLTEQQVNFFELSEIIKSLIDELPPKRRAIFKLSREKGFTYKEISEILNISQGTVEKQMSKAIHSITSKLSSRYGYHIDI